MCTLGRVVKAIDLKSIRFSFAGSNPVVCGGCPGFIQFEPGTSCSQNKNHTARLTTRYLHV